MKTIKQLTQQDIQQAIGAHFKVPADKVRLTITPAYDGGPLDSSPANVSAKVEVEERDPEPPAPAGMHADCQVDRRNHNLSYPRTCQGCGLRGPCLYGLH